MATKFQVMLQENDGPFVPTDEWLTLEEWEVKYAGRFQFEMKRETLFDRNKYYAFTQVNETTKKWVRADLEDPFADIIEED